MSRLSDDEKRVFTDRIAELEEYRHLYHLECTKVMSREAIIEQLSETELAKDVTRLEEENTLLAEHNQAMRELLIQREMVWGGFTRQVAEVAIDALLEEQEDE